MIVCINIDMKNRAMQQLVLYLTDESQINVYDTKILIIRKLNISKYSFLGSLHILLKIIQYHYLPIV